MKRPKYSADDHEAWFERACIMEVLGGLPRPMAEKLAHERMRDIIAKREVKR